MSSGISLKDFAPSAAKIHKLSADLLRVESSVAVPGCRNAYGPFVLFPSPVEAVLACNPQYAGPEEAPENPVVKVRIENNKPVFTTLVPGKDTGVQIHDLGLLESGRMLVSARATNGGADGWKGTYVSAKRVSLTNPSDTTVNTLPVAGHTVRLPKSKATLAACVVDPDTSRCVPKTFGVVFDSPSTTQGNAPVRTCTLRVDYKNDFVSFEQPLF